MAGALACLIGAILQTASEEIIMLTVARVVTGTGVGFMTANVPVVSLILAGTIQLSTA